MKRLPAGDCSRGVTFTLADFLEAGRERLQLELLAGEENLSREVLEPIVNRTGLALTGFFEHFAHKRLQLVGNAEMAYLKSLDRETAERRLADLVRHGANAFVFTGSKRPNPGMLELLRREGAVVMASSLKTRVFSNRSAFVLEQLGAPRATIYGTMIEVFGLGVLIEGAPGLGKSETALGLIKHGCALVADDLTCIRKDVVNNCLFGSASDSTAGYMEIRGIGIMDVTRIFGVTAVRGEKRLQLIITFKRLEDVREEIDRIGQMRRTKDILGVEVPHVIIPVSEGRDLVNLVETAAQQHKLTLAGYDPVQGLSERLHRRAAEMESTKVSKVENKRKRKGESHG